MRCSSRNQIAFILILAGLAGGLPCLALPGDPSSPPNLSDMSIEDLMQVEVTSVSRHPQKLSDTATAIYVLNQDDIRRSGANSIPDLLRMVPGLDVAQVNANTWAISSRGFSGVFATKMLVLVDGRSVYSPFFSGVYWDVQDTLIEDIDRIEVIRGPGATTWGANAVNGVINIITKNAAQTRGTLVTAEAGANDQQSAAVRHGGSLGPHGNYRAFVKYDDNPTFKTPSGASAADAWDAVRGGVRADFSFGGKDTLMVESDVYTNRARLIIETPVLTAPFATLQNQAAAPAGGDVVVNWTRQLSPRSSIDVSGYFDTWNREDEGRWSFHAVDVDFQHNYALTDLNNFSWGAGFRSSSGDYTGVLSGNAEIKPIDRRYSSFVTDEQVLIPDRLSVTLGTKFEESNLGGFNTEPSARAAWMVKPHHEIWASISRAVRTPSWGERIVNFPLFAEPTPSGIPILVELMGNPKSRSEDLLAYEAGYRLQPSTAFSLDIASFFNIYHHLATADLMNPSLEQEGDLEYLLAAALFGNQRDAKSRGLEAVARWNPYKRIKITGSYSWMNITSRAYTSGVDILGVGILSSSPQNQFDAQFAVALSRKIDWETAWMHAGSIAAVGLPAYSRVDSHLTWRVNGDLDLSVGARNLTGWRGMEESVSSIFAVSERNPGKSMYLKCAWRF